MDKAGQIVSKFGPVFKEAAHVIDQVAPWLGPIGIGLKVTTLAVGFFVEEKMTVDQLCQENLKLNKEILSDVTEILGEVNKLKSYLKYGSKFDDFIARYNSYKKL